MVLVFGATGFTGRMVVADLVERGVDVRISGRSEERLRKLSDRHGGLDWAVADVKDPESVGRAADGTDVLVTTVGPYSWWGEIAADAAVKRSIPYIDITGEPAFVRDIFEIYGPRAAAAGSPMLTAMGYDYVPGNLAGALALEAGGGAVHSVDIGYFLSGETSRSPKSLSGGTLRSLRASGSAMQFAWRDGELVEERGAKRVLKFDLGGDKSATAISIGSSEHLSLPRLHPGLQTVNVGLGWFGGASRAVSLFSAISEQAERLPLVGGLLRRGSGDSGNETKQRIEPVGPTDDSRERSRTKAIAIARDARGNELVRVMLDGPNPYDLTGKIVGWAAQQAANGAIAGVGALGPVEAFGLEPLRAACESVGLKEI
ncbi:MAG: NAD(P)H-binding protein [Solirubrobacterales bacterium]